MRRLFPLFWLFWAGSVLFTNPFGDIMSDASLATTVSVVDRGTMELSPHSAADLALVHGKYYCGVGPGSWVLAIPFYLLAKPLIAALPDGLQKQWQPGYAMQLPQLRAKEVYFLQILLVWLLMAPLQALLLLQVCELALRLGHSRSSALWVTLGVGLGSLSFVYSCVYSRQFLAGALIWNVALWHLNRGLAPGGRPPGREAFVLSGLLLGVAVTVDYPMMIVALACAPLFAGRSRLEKSSLLAGFLAPLTLLGAFHTWLFGNPFLTPYHYRAWMSMVIRSVYKNQMVASNEFQTGPLLGLTHPTPASVYGLSFSAFKGIFVFCPVAAAGTWVLLRQRSGEAAVRLRRLALPALGALFLFASSLKGELYWSGFPVFFGPRYLVGAAPLAALGLLLWRPQGRERWLLKAIVLGSVANMLLGAMFHDRMLIRHSNDPTLQWPLAFLLLDLLESGPRVPLLDIRGVSALVQSALVLLYAGGWAVAFRRARVER